MACPRRCPPRRSPGRCSTSTPPARWFRRCMWRRSANCSNSGRLAEVGRRSGAEAYLIDDADGLDIAWLAGAATVGVTAGASAPEVLVQGVIDRLAETFAVEVRELDAERETVSF